MQLCRQSAAAWRGNPLLPSRACKFSSTITDKAYSAAGQAASALHAIALLQVHQAKALKQLHEGGADPGVLQELRTVTHLALRAAKITAWALGQTMSTLVVQEHHLWLTLVDMREADKHHFMDSRSLRLAYSAKRWRALPNSSLPHSSRRRRSVTSCPGGPLLSPPHRRCSPSVCSSPMAPSCCLHLRSSSTSAAAFTTAAAWSWPQGSRTARLHPCQACEAPGQVASLRRATRSSWILLFRRW